MTRTTISHIERGHSQPSFELLERLSNALNTPVYHFFYFAEGMEPTSFYGNRRIEEMVMLAQVLPPVELEQALEIMQVLAKSRK